MSCKQRQVFPEKQSIFERGLQVDIDTNAYHQSIFYMDNYEACGHYGPGPLIQQP